MIKNKRPLLLCMILLFTIIPVYSGILPYFKHKNGTKYFLIAQEKYGKDKYKWGDFSGGKEGNETPRQTAVREAAEETGYKLGGKKFWNSKIRGKAGNHFFVADITKKVVSLGGRMKVLKKLKGSSKEIMNYAWISERQLRGTQRLPKIKGYKIVFRGFFQKKRKALANAAK